MDTKVIPLREAAERLGITAKAIKYRLRARGITPIQTEGRFGPTLAIDEEQFQAVCRPVSVLGGGASGVPSLEIRPEGNLETMPSPEVSLEGSWEETPPQGEIPVATADPTLTMALELATKTMEALAAERAERERAQQDLVRAERRAEALAVELGAYRRALAENAESLAEERARRMAVEAREVEAREVEEKQQLELLKVDTPTRGTGWGQRVRRWFGLRSQAG